MKFYRGYEENGHSASYRFFVTKREALAAKTETPDLIIDVIHVAPNRAGILTVLNEYGDG